MLCAVCCGTGDWGLGRKFGDGVGLGEGQKSLGRWGVRRRVRDGMGETARVGRYAGCWEGEGGEDERQTGVHWDESCGDKNIFW